MLASGSLRASERAVERETARDGCCTAITGEPNIATGRSLNGLNLFLSFIDI